MPTPHPELRARHAHIVEMLETIERQAGARLSDVVRTMCKFTNQTESSLLRQWHRWKSESATLTVPTFAQLEALMNGAREVGWLDKWNVGGNSNDEGLRSLLDWLDEESARRNVDAVRPYVSTFVKTMFERIAAQDYAAQVAGRKTGKLSDKSKSLAKTLPALVGTFAVEIAAQIDFHFPDAQCRPLELQPRSLRSMAEAMKRPLEILAKEAEQIHASFEEDQALRASIWEPQGKRKLRLPTK